MGATPTRAKRNQDMLNIFKNARRAVVTLAGAAVISAACTAATTGTANALSWKQHACWCKHHNGRLHGPVRLHRRRYWRLGCRYPHPAADDLCRHQSGAISAFSRLRPVPALPGAQPQRPHHACA